MVDDQDKENFLYPKANYRGNFSPEHLVFNANLQEFAQKVMYICNLETNGKISPDEAYHEIKALWKKVKQSKKGLNVGDKPAENSQE